jgi:hypothetical protein
MTTQLALRNLKDQRRIDSLLGIAPGTPWSTTQHVLAHLADATLAEDLADALGDESTDNIALPWSK